MEIVGIVTFEDGAPASDVIINYVDLKYGLSLNGMPRVGESGEVRTSKGGDFLISLSRVHDAVDISINENPRCGFKPISIKVGYEDFSAGKATIKLELCG